MIIKYFDEFEGKWLDISGNTGSTLVKGADDWTTSQGYSVLTLLINQSGTDDPTATELEKTISAGYSFNRGSSGVYQINFDNAILSQGKTFITMQSNDNKNSVYRDSDDSIVITTNGDDILYFTSFELRVYN